MNDQTNKEVNDMNELRFEHIENSLLRMENAMEKQADSVSKISEAVIRMSAQQEIMSSLVIDTKTNGERITLLEKQSAVSQEAGKVIPVLVKRVGDMEKDVIEIDKKVLKNTLTISAIVGLVVAIGKEFFTTFFS